MWLRKSHTQEGNTLMAQFIRVNNWVFNTNQIVSVYFDADGAGLPRITIKVAVPESSYIEGCFSPTEHVFGGEQATALWKYLTSRSLDLLHPSISSDAPEATNGRT
jgi:hypothetical protein